jgi:hypothetical protein
MAGVMYSVQARNARIVAMHQRQFNEKPPQSAETQARHPPATRARTRCGLARHLFERKKVFTLED